MNQVAHQPEQDRPDQGSYEQLNDLAQTIIARTQASRSMVSPWVQRALAEQASISTAGPGRARRPQPALTGPGLGSMLRKVQHRSEGSRVWRPDVGSLQPELVDRFAGAIVRRFPAIAGKYEPQPLRMASTGQAAMILPGDSPPVLESETAPAQPEQPWPSLVDLQRAVEARSSWSHAPDRPAQARPQIQRTTAEPPRPSPPLHPAGPRPKLFSRVEEISPSGRRSTRVRSSGTPLEPAAVDESSEAAGLKKRTPEGPVQKSAEVDVKSSPITDEPSAKGEVQRQVTAEPGEQTLHRQTEMPGVEPTPPERDDLPEIEPFDRDMATSQTERRPVSSPPLKPARPESAQAEPDHTVPAEPAQNVSEAAGSPPDWVQPEAEPGPSIEPSPPLVQRQSKVTRPDRASDPGQVGSTGESVGRPGQAEPDQTEAAKTTQPKPDVSGSPIDRRMEDTQEEREPAPGLPAEPAKSPIQRRPDSAPAPVKPERSSPKVAAPSPQASEEGAVEDRSVSGSAPKPVERPVQRQETKPVEAAPSQSESIRPGVDETDQRLDQERVVQSEPPPDGPEWPGSSADPGLLADRMEPRPEPTAPAQFSSPLVQRQTRADRPPPGQPRQTGRRVEESSPPELEPATPGAAVPGEDGGAVREEHSTTAEDSLSLVQRRSEPARKPAVEFDSGLEEQLLARAASRVELPLIEPLRPGRPLARIKPMLQTQPAQTNVQARFEGSDVGRRAIEPLDPGRSLAQTMPALPVQPLVMARREAAAVRPDSAGGGPAAGELSLPRLGPPGAAVRASAAGPAMILRAEEPAAVAGRTEAAGEEQAEPGVDLDQLARQVYPHVRRLLQIERERRAGLSTLHDL